jgi:transcriptional regulator with XRE-family HTH domain
MKRSRARLALPIPARRALGKLGADLRAARQRRRITMQLMAERALISAPTLGRVEAGDPGVSLGIYASVLFVLGMVDRLGDLVDARTDPYVLDLDEERLPQRVRTPARKRGKDSR